VHSWRDVPKDPPVARECVGIDDGERCSCSVATARGDRMPVALVTRGFIASNFWFWRNRIYFEITVETAFVYCARSNALGSGHFS